MSKVDAQRAMREARFAAYREKLAAEARAAATSSTSVRATAPETLDASSTPTLDASPEGADSESGLCGHRNIGNKTCRRVAGHAEKTHRYT